MAAETSGLEIKPSCMTDEILQAILPEDLLEDSPTGFAVTGHLGMEDVATIYSQLSYRLINFFAAHINLNAEYLPYKHIIGQVVMDVGCFRSRATRPLLILQTSNRRIKRSARSSTNWIPLTQSSGSSRWSSSRVNLISSLSMYAHPPFSTTSGLMSLIGSTSPIADLRLISRRFTGIRGCTPSTTASCNYSSRQTLLQTYLQASVHSLFPRGKKAAVF